MLTILGYALALFLCAGLILYIYDHVWEFFAALRDWIKDLFYRE